ncbi:MAG: hypothetical protein JWM05_7 [Acidimicrobiales bacterium]|nr:hypothetical protein [Acidimicrobiales bacterium]
MDVGGPCGHDGRHRPAKGTKTMELLDALAQTFDHASGTIGGVRADQLADTTPCTEWDVRTLLSHLTGVVTNMGLGASGSPLLADTSAFQIGDEPAIQFRSAADGTIAAWTARNLADTVDVGAGPMPAQVAMTINLVDTATHTWDVARATGQPDELPGELGPFVLDLAHGFVNDDVRNFAGIGPAIPVDPAATPTTQLAAFMGRQP